MKPIHRYEAAIIRHAVRRAEQARARIHKWDARFDALHSKLPKVPGTDRVTEAGQAPLSKIELGPLARAEKDIAAWWDRVKALMEEHGADVLIVNGLVYINPDRDFDPPIGDDPMLGCRLQSDRILDLDRGEVLPP